MASPGKPDFPQPEIWHDGQRAYFLVNKVQVSYPRFERVKLESGLMALRSLPPLEYTICTAVPCPTPQINPTTPRR